MKLIPIPVDIHMNSQYVSSFKLGIVCLLILILIYFKGINIVEENIFLI